MYTAPNDYNVTETVRLNILFFFFCCHRKRKSDDGVVQVRQSLARSMATCVVCRVHGPRLRSMYVTVVVKVVQNKRGGDGKNNPFLRTIRAFAG